MKIRLMVLLAHLYLLILNQHYQKHLKRNYHLLLLQRQIVHMKMLQNHQQFIKTQLLLKVCISFVVLFYFTWYFLLIFYILVAENQSIELSSWLKDLNNNSILCETISDVSTFIERLIKIIFTFNVLT